MFSMVNYNTFKELLHIQDPDCEKSIEMVDILKFNPKRIPKFRKEYVHTSLTYCLPNIKKGLVKVICNTIVIIYGMKIIEIDKKKYV